MKRLTIYLHEIRRSTAEALGRSSYRLFFVAVTVLIVFLLAWLPNLQLLRYIMLSPSIGVFGKARFLLGSLDAYRTNFTPFSGLTAFASAVLLGLNASLIMYYFSWQRKLLAADSGLSIIGTVAGVLGIGCASCGSVILSLVGFSGALAFLPLGGQELNLLGIILLLVSYANISQRIHAKGTCSV